MKRVWRLAGLLIFGLLLTALGGDRASAGAESKSTIVVELFTSQGCSSCPPADRWLSELSEREDVVALSFHVDYWNYIGWTDPFSSDAWSDRQRSYARAFESGRIYTPQMVVNGRWQGVGSDRLEITSLLGKARATPPTAEIKLFAEPVTDNRLTVAVSANRIAGADDRKPLAAWLAIVESDLETRVGRGENALKTLSNDRVVRHLEPVFEIGTGQLAATGSVEIVLADGWRPDRLSAVTLLQETASLRIQAAAEHRLAAEK